MSTRPANRKRCLGRRSVGQRGRVVLATKVRGRMGQGVNQVGLSRLHIIEAVEASLRRLGTDYIDLYQIHRYDPLTNLEDTLRALDDLVRAGKVRYIGCSNLAAWQMMKALAISRSEGLARFRCTQSFYSLAGRDLERDDPATIKDQGLGLLVWSPLAGGLSDGQILRRHGDRCGRTPRAPSIFLPSNKERGFADYRASVERWPRNHGATPAQVAIAWLLARDAVTSVIIGAKSVAQLDDNLRSADLALTADELASLEAISRLIPEYPAWMEMLPSDRLPGQERRFDRQ